MSDDLEQLRREGAARLAEADLEKRQQEDARVHERLERDTESMRLAVGRYRYRTLRKLVLWASLPALPIFAVALFMISFDFGKNDVLVVVIGASLAWLFGGLWLWASEIAWRASARAMREERKWIESRPFPVTGYFEWLRRSDHESASLRVSVRGPGIQGEDLRMLVGAVHPEVTVQKGGRGGAEIELSSIVGRDDDQRARVVHELVDRVLTPLFRQTPFESVALS